jgi:CRP/FNR family transcriptional regulator
MRDKPFILELEMASIPNRPANEAVIEACSVLNPLDPSLKESFSSQSYMAYAERGETIFMAGASSEFVAVVGAGFVKMTRSAANGQEITMELLGPGQCFGLLVAIEGRSFPLNAVAVTNCWYLKIPTRVFTEAYQSSGPLKDTIVRYIGPRLRKAHDMMTRLSSGRVEERIAAVLFILSDSYGTRTADGLRLDVPLTRQDIAEMAGTTVETTIRILSKWQKDGMLSTEKHFITLIGDNARTGILHGA